jgi:hypothetical protein
MSTAEAPTEAPPPVAAVQKPIYVHDPNTGAITRNGVLLGTRDPAGGGMMWESAEFQRSYRPVLLKRGIKFTSEVIRAPFPVEATPAEVASMGASKSAEVAAAVALLPAPLPIHAFAPVPADPYAPLNARQREAVLRLRRDRGWPDLPRQRTRPPVKLDKHRGDKVDKFILDLLEYDPVAFVSRYGVTGIGKITKVEKFELDKVEKKRKKVVEAVLSKRKTFLTELASGQSVVAESDDGEEAEGS